MCKLCSLQYVNCQSRFSNCIVLTMAEEITLDTLNDQQRKILLKFRESVEDLLDNKHDDVYLLRWLIAREFDLEKAEKMIRDNFQWRKEWDVDNILDWKVPSVKKYDTKGHIGCDYEGYPVAIDFAGDCDINGMFKSATKRDIIRAHILRHEKLEVMFEEQSKKLGKRIHQHVCIMDLEGLKLADVMSKDVLSTFTTMTQFSEAHYPECVKTVYVINTPSFYMFIHNIFSRFASEKTLAKVKIFSTDRSTWIPVLRSVMDPEILPKHWGGERTDPDGNPRCLELIPIGLVPKCYYLDNNLNPDDIEDDMTPIVIGKGSKVEVPFQIKKSNTTLRYCFWSEDTHIVFGITFSSEANSNELTEIIKPSKVESHVDVQKGMISCSPGIYTIIFDNTESWFRAKHVHYSIKVEE